MLTQQTIQFEDRGSIPTTPQNIKKWRVRRVERKEIRDFIELWHYSKNINGCIADYCYALFDEFGVMKGAMFFGRMAMANQWKRFSSKEWEVIELRRLCCVDNTPKNAESYFIGRALKLLSEDWRAGLVVSYADKEAGHSGTIYKASNFKQLEDIKGAKVIVHGDKTFHDKAIRTKYKGELKPFAKRLKKALEDGEAHYKTTKGKHTFTYKLRN